MQQRGDNVADAQSDGRRAAQRSANVAQPAARVLDALRSFVFSEEAVTGGPLSEIALAQRFGVSRTPVREALKQLQTEGLVEIRPKVGTFVREPSPAEVTELFAIKEVLEGLAARLVAARGHIPELDSLRDNIQASDAAVRALDQQRYAELVLGFHTTLMNGADATKLSHHYTLLMNQLAYRRTVVRSFKSNPRRMEISVNEHRRIFELIEAKDQYAAELAMREHVRSTAAEALSNGRIPLA